MKVLRYSFLFACALATSNSLYGQQNISLVSNLDYQHLHRTGINDVWGYVATNGVEYACVGTEIGISIVDLSDPAKPAEVFWVPELNSTWRDLKVHDHHLFVTNETGGGLTIIDMTQIPWNTNLPVYHYTGGGMSSAHNIFIDEFGFAYLFGSNIGNGGALILNLSTPSSPVQVGIVDDWYLHDGYVKNNTLYGAHIFDGFFSIVDVSDKANPNLLATHFTPGVFTHNVWPSDNGNYLFTTDEISGGVIGVYDITDLNNIQELDREQVNNSDLVVPHNVHVLNEFLITSYYTSGVVIHNSILKDNVVEIGRYDTSPIEGSGYSGCWGAYPYLPSGLILATDREEGLFVLQPNYFVPGYLEGLVQDASTNLPIGGATVELLGAGNIERSAVNGQYKTGAPGGTFDIALNRLDYFPDTVRNVSITNTLIQNRNFQLVPRPKFDLVGTALDASSGDPIENAIVSVSNPLYNYETTSDADGKFTIPSIYEGTYAVLAGAWGFGMKCEDIYISNVPEFEIELPQGYFDDFTLDYGWLVTSSATAGRWERGAPQGTINGADLSNPGEGAADSTSCSGFAFVTGNSGAGNTDDDVDGGHTKLVSPFFDGTQFSDPWINYYLWFYNGGGLFGLLNDEVRIKVYNGSTTSTIDTVSAADSLMSRWVFNSHNLTEHIEPTTTMQLIVETEDQDLLDNILEVGFDGFSVTANVEGVGVEEFVDAAIELNLYPNPVSGSVMHYEIPNNDGISDLSIVDMQGKLVISQQSVANSGNISLDGIDNGPYLFVVESGGKKSSRIFIRRSTVQ